MISERDTVYLSGPMTGFHNENFAAFNMMEEKLRKKYQCKILNPSKQERGLSYQQCIEIDLAMVRASTVVLMLDGWQNSPGAKKELSEAINHNKRIITEREV